MLPYIALWLAAAIAAYYLFRWDCKTFAIWINSDVIFFSTICLIFSPVTLLVALVWTGILVMQRSAGTRLSNWLDRPSKW
jgi:hypothetical protein